MKKTDTCGEVRGISKATRAERAELSKNPLELHISNEKPNPSAGRSGPHTLRHDVAQPWRGYTRADLSPAGSGRPGTLSGSWAAAEAAGPGSRAAEAAARAAEVGAATAAASWARAAGRAEAAEAAILAARVGPETWAAPLRESRATP